MRKVKTITATTKSEIEFRKFTLLGRSLELIPDSNQIDVNAVFNNFGQRRIGLSKIYNMFLRPEFAEEILLFIHDDAYINDWNIVYRLNEAIEQYDVAGIAGNTDPDFAEPSWALGWNREKYPTGWQSISRGMLAVY